MPRLGQFPKPVCKCSERVWEVGDQNSCLLISLWCSYKVLKLTRISPKSNISIRFESRPNCNYICSLSSFVGGGKRVDLKQVFCNFGTSLSLRSRRALTRYARVDDTALLTSSLYKQHIYTPAREKLSDIRDINTKPVHNGRHFFTFSN